MLQAKSLNKTFRRGTKDIMAVQDVNLNLEAGHVTTVIGNSGSGKSTLLNLLAGLLTPTSGTVTFDGENLYDMSDQKLSRFRNQNIGVIPQGQTALSNLTVLQNVMLPTGLYSEEKDTFSRAMELLEQVGISHLASAKPATLSGGELRRMATVRAIIQNPCILLADEPTNDLDEESMYMVMSLIRKVADEGATVLLVTHEMDILESTDTVMYMKNGRIYRNDF
jgi:putative ABC transport system ATP-binding protein